MPEEPKTIDLISTTTEDGVTLHGALHAAESGQSLDVESPVDVWIVWHGVGGNFYSGRLFHPLVKALTESGVAVAVVNSRGHDGLFTALAEGAPRRMGAAFELVSECRQDARGWITALQRLGFQRIGLLGHSLGAVKAIYSQAQDAFECVTRVVSVSAPALSFQRFSQSPMGDVFRADFAKASELKDSGRGQDLFEAQVPFPLWIAADSYIDKYGPEENYELTRWTELLRVPTLLLYGSLELDAPSGAFLELPAQLKRLENAAEFLTVETISGADHFYADRSTQLSRSILAWLRGGAAQ